jgi:predicted DNA-binding antitoxin AbrB/MazE fold protein
MSQTIRAIYHNGLIEPLEKLNLTENTEITVTISKRKKRFSLEGIIENGKVDEKALDEVTKIWESRITDSVLLSKDKELRATGLNVIWSRNPNEPIS